MLLVWLCSTVVAYVVGVAVYSIAAYVVGAAGDIKDTTRERKGKPHVTRSNPQSFFMQ